tara:strand:+ start:81 stop:470 length:390 start_codon:yes stop_codon:yes gene_type:complete
MSTLKVNTIQDSSGSNASTTEQINQGRAKAWCNFNGTGTPAIRDSFNISSLTDNATGDFTLNFSNAFSNTNYCLAGTSGPNSEYIGNHLNSGGTTENYTTSSCRFTIKHVYNNNLSDAEFNEVMILGDN